MVVDINSKRVRRLRDGQLIEGRYRRLWRVEAGWRVHQHDSDFPASLLGARLPVLTKRTYLLKQCADECDLFIVFAFIRTLLSLEKR